MNPGFPPRMALGHPALQESWNSCLRVNHKFTDKYSCLPIYCVAHWTPGPPGCPWWPSSSSSKCPWPLSGHAWDKGDQRAIIFSHSVMLLLSVCLWVEVVEVHLINFVGEDRLIPNIFKVIKISDWSKSGRWLKLTQVAVWMQVSQRRWAPRKAGKPRWTKISLSVWNRKFQNNREIASIYPPWCKPEWWVSLFRMGFCTEACLLPSPSSGHRSWSPRLVVSE